MPLDCPSLTNDFLPALVGEFAEVRAPSKENLGIISTIKLATKERLQLDCTISAQKRLGELNSIVSEAEAIEHDILIQVAPSIDQTNRTGFVRWWVGDGEKWWSSFFQRVFRLYEIRHGKSEADKLMQIFSDKNNNERYFLYIEYGAPHIDLGITIRKIFLWDKDGDKQKKQDSNADHNGKDEYIEPIA